MKKQYFFPNYTGELFYEPETGEVYCDGELLSLKLNSHGYKSIKYNGWQYQVHRLAFKLQNIDIDGKCIYHKNLDKTDNRFDNLQIVTRNQMNQLRFNERKQKRENVKNVFISQRKKS